MPGVDPGDFLRVTTSMHGLASQLVQNVFHFHTMTGNIHSDSDTANAIGGYLNAAFDHIYHNVVDEVTPLSFKVQNLVWDVDRWVVEEDHGEWTWTLTHAFDAAGDAMPDGVAAVISFSTNTPKMRGRKFIYGLDDTVASASIIGETVMGNLASMAASLLAPAYYASDGFLLPIVVSQVRQWSDDLIAATVNDVLGYQRRRKPGVGL